MNECLLILLLSCQPKVASALTLAHATVAFADTWQTQRAVDRCAQRPGCYSSERNPLARPFQTNGKPLAYAATTAGVFGTAWLADRMRRSNNWTRKVWWLPQIGLTVGSAVGIGLTRQDNKKWH